jgi:hypothetical protein
MVSSSSTTRPSTTAIKLTSTEQEIEEDSSRMMQKKKLLGLLGGAQKKTFKDPVLADPITKEAIVITTNVQKSTATMIGSFGSLSGQPARINFTIQSPSNTFRGTSDTYLDLLEPIIIENGSETTASSSSSSPMANILKQAMPYIPFQLRGVLSSATGVDEEIIPMRDLFTSPAVSFAYERGWRQGFSSGKTGGGELSRFLVHDADKCYVRFVFRFSISNPVPFSFVYLCIIAVGCVTKNDDNMMNDYSWLSRTRYRSNNGQ